MSILGNWSDRKPVKLRLRIIRCDTAFTKVSHCELHLRQTFNFYGPKQWNMHNLLIRSCCYCAHVLDNFKESEWKELADKVGYDYTPYQLPKVESHTVYSLKIKTKICKMCKEEDAEKGSKYCETCKNWRERRGLDI